jgi:serine/threonine protein kinase
MLLLCEAECLYRGCPALKSYESIHAGSHEVGGTRQSLAELKIPFSLVQGVANRDLKLENILLSQQPPAQTRPLLKLCDFGYSKVRSGYLHDGALSPCS